MAQIPGRGVWAKTTQWLWKKKHHSVTPAGVNQWLHLLRSSVQLAFSGVWDWHFKVSLAVLTVYDSKDFVGGGECNKTSMTSCGIEWKCKKWKTHKSGNNYNLNPVQGKPIFRNVPLTQGVRHSKHFTRCASSTFIFGVPLTSEKLCNFEKWMLQKIKICNVSGSEKW